MGLLDDLAEQQADIYAKLTDAQERVSYLNQQYAINHYGGQSPSQFAAIIAPVQNSVSDFAKQLTEIQFLIQKQQVKEAAVQSTYSLAPISTASPQAAQVAQQPAFDIAGALNDFLSKIGETVNSLFSGFGTTQENIGKSLVDYQGSIQKTLSEALTSQSKSVESVLGEQATSVSAALTSQKEDIQNAVGKALTEQAGAVQNVVAALNATPTQAIPSVIQTSSGSSSFSPSILLLGAAALAGLFIFKKKLI